ncbi:MAG: hypothetical protein WCQ69_08955 [Bacteroidales bacterium]|jgi:hypothetical protein
MALESEYPFRTLGPDAPNPSDAPEPIEAMTAAALSQEREPEPSAAERRAAAAAAASSMRRTAQEAASVQKRIEKRHEQLVKQAEAAETRAIMRKIAAYMSRFPWLAEVVPRMRASPSLDEARDMLETIREAMMSQGSVNSIAQLLNHAFTMAEIWWGNGQRFPAVPPPLRFDITGISKLFRENKFPELTPLLMEIDVEYPWLGRRSLPSRFASALVAVILKVNAINTDPNARRAMEMSQQGPVNVDDVDAEDL